MRLTEGSEVEGVPGIPCGVGGVGVGEAVHFCMDDFAVKAEGEVVVVNVVGAFIEVLGVAFDFIRLGRAAAGDEVGNAVF